MDKQIAQWLHEKKRVWYTGSKSQRLGQHLVNQLADLDRNLYMNIPLDVDCFYDDSRISKFEQWLIDVGNAYQGNT